MLSICIYGFPLLGLIGLILEILVWLKNCRHVGTETIPIKAWSFLIGLFVAVVGFFIRYPIGHSYKVYGFPFIVAIFERTPNGWVDYAAGWGSLGFAIVLNALVFGLLPQFWLRKRLTREN